MNLPYLSRLALICLSSFFLIEMILCLAVFLATPAAVRVAGQLRARLAASLTLSLRLLPAVGAAAAVALLCFPSYVSLERNKGMERVGPLCLIGSALGLGMLAWACARAAIGVARSRRFIRECKRTASAIRLDEESEPVFLSPSKTPLVALTGLLRPRLVISQPAINLLTADQLRVALQHEQVHRTSRDNLKRLLFLLAPVPIPLLPRFTALERSWSRFSEWAADDQATAGRPSDSLLLAEALIRFARFATHIPASPLLSEFLPDPGDLKCRIERLLCDNQLHQEPRPRRFRMKMIAFGVAALLCPLLLNLPTLHFVHECLERLIR
jgi:hypothetical protein